MTDAAFFGLIDRPFRKMNGIGNDFVVLDGRTLPVWINRPAARAIANRATGPGFDQLIVLENTPNADVFMRILNADGSESGACGNATRCVARLLMDETGRDAVIIETIAGLLRAKDAGAWDRVSVNMGPARLAARDIPLALPDADTARVPFDLSSLAPSLPPVFSAVNIGNPHAVFFVHDVEAHDLARVGPLIEHHPLFPQRVNVSLANVTARNAITLKVWERGVGLTLACGSAACAAGVAAFRAGLSERAVAVSLPGGALEIEWRVDGDVMMTGPIALDYESTLHAGIFATAGPA
jgi:diaminopimelate epimerase